VLRDTTPEFRRTFLQTLALVDNGASSFLSGEQSASIGETAVVSPMGGLLFARLDDLDGHTIGVVAAQCDTKPNDDVRAQLHAFCSAAARVLAIAGALAVAQRQSRESRLLAMVNERLHKSLDRRELLTGIVDGVRNAFRADRCVVFERTLDGKHAAVVAEAPHEAMADSVKIDGDLRKVFGGLTLRRDRLPAESATYGRGARSAIAMPFIVDGRVEDAMLLAFHDSRRLDDSDVNALRVLAFHVGLALSNTRLYERERARRRQAESLERVVRILRDTQYVDEVLLVFVVTVSHELPVDCAAYAIEGNALERRAMRLRDTHGFSPESTVKRDPLEPFLTIDDPSASDAIPPAARRSLFGAAHGVVIPLRMEGRLWGMFTVRASGEDLDWPPEERSTFFRTLGSHLEIALANAHAYERELRRAQERETLAEAARTILSYTAMQPLADVMCRFAASLVHAERACVLRWSGERYAQIGVYGEGIEETIATSGFDVEQRAERATSGGADERRVQRLIDGPGYVVIPLSRTASERPGDAIDAFLIVGKSSEARFARDDLRLMQELGALLALALHNLDLYEAMQRANRALQESNEFKDDLLAMLAHDFKGPLTVISGYCELLLEGNGDRPTEVETIFSQTRRLVRLSEDALVLAQTQSEGFSLAREVVDLGAFVAEWVETTARGNERIELDLPVKPVMVELDSNRFRHVLDNLVANALKYSEAPVRIAVRAVNDHAELEVADLGIGIPEEELPSLFTRFGRATNARRRGIAGSGVGLYISRKIVDVHRGTVDVQSKEDAGSTFTVSLPLSP